MLHNPNSQISYLNSHSFILKTVMYALTSLKSHNFGYLLEENSTCSWQGKGSHYANHDSARCTRFAWKLYQTGIAKFVKMLKC